MAVPSPSWKHCRGFRLGSGLENVLAMKLSWYGVLPFTPWWTWLCGMGHCSAGQTNLQIWGRLSEQKEASFYQDNLVFGLLHAEAPPNHDWSFTKFHLIFTGYIVMQAVMLTHLSISLAAVWKPFISSKPPLNYLLICWIRHTYVMVVQH